MKTIYYQKGKRNVFLGGTERFSDTHGRNMPRSDPVYEARMKPIYLKVTHKGDRMNEMRHTQIRRKPHVSSLATWTLMVHSENRRLTNSTSNVIYQITRSRCDRQWSSGLGVYRQKGQMFESEGRSEGGWQLVVRFVITLYLMDPHVVKKDGD